MIYEDQSRGGNNPTIEEIMKIVEDINNYYTEVTGDTDYFPLDIQSNGMEILISVFNIRDVWFSGEDDRPYDGEENYIPLETYLIDKIILIIRDLNKLAFK